MFAPPPAPHPLQGIHSPPRLGDDHLGAVLVEASPQITGLQADFRLVLLQDLSRSPPDVAPPRGQGGGLQLRAQEDPCWRWWVGADHLPPCAAPHPACWAAVESHWAAAAARPPRLASRCSAHSGFESKVAGRHGRLLKTDRQAEAVGGASSQKQTSCLADKLQQINFNTSWLNCRIYHLLYSYTVGGFSLAPPPAPVGGAGDGSPVHLQQSELQLQKTLHHHDTAWLLVLPTLAIPLQWDE